MKAHQIEWNFESRSLFDQICDLQNLKHAFKRVKKNKGAPGIDGITIKSYETNLENNLRTIQQEVLNWTYKPTPVKRVEIPKPNGKGIRLLGIPIVKDRVLHMAIKNTLEPVIDPTFSDNSYGFRPGKNQRQAVETAKEHVKSGKDYIVDIDLSKFFDRINHDRLIYRLGTLIDDKQVLRLVGMILRSGIMAGDKIIFPSEGSVQGSPLSPLLSNIVLDELDKELERRNLAHCRFADDCNIFVGTERAAERVMRSIKKFIEKKLKLIVNEEKSKTAKADKVKFLGMTIAKGCIAISKAAFNKAMEKVKELTPRGTHLTFEKSVEMINRWYAGWANYFKMTQYPAQLAAIEAHIRRRLRARFIHQNKYRKPLFKKLVSRGVKPGIVSKHVYSNKGTWKLSHSYAMHKGYSIEWFITEGKQKIFSDLNLPEWLPIKEWVKLT